MAISATEWVWEHSRARNGPLIVLLAIAREIDAKGECVMSIAELAANSRLSARSVVDATDSLTRAGDLKVDAKAGRNRRNGYRLRMDGHVRSYAESAQCAESAVQDLHSPGCAESAQPASEAAGQAPQCAESAQPDASDVLDLGSVVSGGKSRSKPSSEPPRDDVERLCAHLASRIEANGSKRPNIGKRWRDAARLLIDNDGRTEQQVMAAIDWSQANEFWHRNILSMPKLREKYDQLRLAALAEQRRKSQPGRQQETDDQFKRAMQRIKARKENTNGAGGDSDDRPLRQVALPPAGD